jgi:glycosyltransferase involved in cell wall biosynthesis
MPVNGPLISCVVPTFNSERYLGEALGSILAQTYRPLDIVVADDGSTDGTARVAAGCGGAARFVSQSTAGPAATRNLGLEAARGEFVAFLDADDLWHPEKLARQMARFGARPDLDASTTHVQMFWADEAAEEGKRYKGHPRARPIPGYSTTTLLARRGLFERIGRFDAGLWFGDAMEWFMRASERGAVIELLPDVLAYHRVHGANLTRRRIAASRDEFLGLVKGALDRRRARQGGGPPPAGPPARDAGAEHGTD